MTRIRRRLFWVRHGPTHARGMVGWSDIPADLSDTAQLARLAAFLPAQAAVISSDLSRAVATADAIAGARTRLPHAPDLREMHFGDWELRRHDDLAGEPGYRAFLEDPGAVRPPGGESWHDLGARVDGAVARILRAHAQTDIIAVAHFGVILSQLQQALRLDAAEAFGHRINNLSVTELHLRDDGWHAERFNHNP